MPLLTAAQLTEHLCGLDDGAVTELLKARPDLLNPAPGDVLGLAVRVQSELSLRQYLQRLDARTLSVLLRIAEAAEQGAPVPDDVGRAELDRLVSHAVVLPGSSEPSESGLSVPANLPHVFESLRLPPGLRHAPDSPPGPEGPAVSAGLVRNASLSAIGEVLGGVEDVLAVLAETPVATLRTGGVGMRELKRLTAQRSGERRPVDAEVGETAWLLELAAAAALIELDVDTGQWRLTPTAQRWESAPRHRKHQLLVSGWLLAPRAPLLIRGPHPTARLAPALGSERHRGDAPALRERLLRTAAELADEPAEPRPDQSAIDPDGNDQPADSPARIWEVRLPDDELPGDDALCGPLFDRLRWGRPLLAARVAPLLAPMVREAERLGLLAAGALAKPGHALARAGETAMADVVEPALPALTEALFLQSDLTAVPAGPLTQEASWAMSEIADRESRGGVATYRFTTSSLASALARGWTVETLTAFLTRHSLTEIPSPLRTLIDDVARTRRRVRIGAAGSWLLEDDPALRAELLAAPELRALGLRPLSEEVLVCEASPSELARAVQRCGIDAHLPESDPREPHPPEAGLPENRPAAASDGARSADRTRSSLQSSPTERAGDAWTLTGSPWQQSPVRTLSAHQLAEDPEVLARAVATLRSGGTGGAPERGADDVVARLRTAARSRHRVRVARVSPDGHEHQVTGVPLALNAGRVRLRTSDDDESVLLLHRVTSVEVL